MRDRANDAVRVNGAEVGAKVIGEGANLGVTQLGRIEYARAGGRIDTDAVDNSAGVDTSDHEVNLKILLSAPLRRNELSAEGRDAPVTPQVLLTVFASNDTICFRAKGLTDRQLRRHIDVLEQAGLLARRDSANGKRFPILQNGKPIGAFGLDLSPLFARSAELLALAERRRQEADELRGIKAQILQLRSLCHEGTLNVEATLFVEGLRNAPEAFRGLLSGKNFGKLVIQVSQPT